MDGQVSVYRRLNLPTPVISCCHALWHADCLLFPPRFVTYFMSRIQLLRSNGIEPLVVFDGGRLPIKGQEEQSRHR